MRQYTRFYLDKDNNIRHVHTNSLPFYFEPVVDKDVLNKIDIEIDMRGKDFVESNEILGNVGVDKDKNPVFLSHQRLKDAPKQVVRNDLKRGHEHGA